MFLIFQSLISYYINLNHKLTCLLPFLFNIRAADPAHLRLWQPLKIFNEHLVQCVYIWSWSWCVQIVSIGGTQPQNTIVFEWKTGIALLCYIPLASPIFFLFSDILLWNKKKSYNVNLVWHQCAKRLLISQKLTNWLLQISQFNLQLYKQQTTLISPFLSNNERADDNGDILLRTG